MDRSKVLPFEINLLGFAFRFQGDHRIPDDLFAVVHLNQDGAFFDFNGDIVPLIERKKVALQIDLLFFLQSQLSLVFAKDERVDMVSEVQQ